MNNYHSNNYHFPKLLFISDCYKYTHAAMYADNVEEVYSLLYCRKPRLNLSSINNHIVAFGMRQVISRLEKYYKEFVECDTDTIMRGLELLYCDFMKFSKNDSAYKFLIDKWLSLPKEMPIIFKALPEGSFVSNNMPIISIQCVDSKHCWFVNFIETFLNSELWKTCFVATKAALFKKIEYEHIGYYLDSSYNFHDFSARGMNGIWDCHSSSMGHILFFSGTDSIMTLKNIYDNYGRSDSLQSIANLGSIPASEHSVMCLGGREREIETFKNIMKRFPKQMVSIVSDTWNLWDIIDSLKNDKEAYELIMKREFPIVLRPDSGDPFLILTGNENSSDSRERLGVIRLVESYFGFDRVKIIYGDAITVDRARQIYHWCRDNGLDATSFLCLGVGSYAYNSGIRDDVGLVTKMTWAKIGGKAEHLIKSPITGSEKISLCGKVGVDRDTREVLQFLDSDMENDLLTDDLSMKSFDSIKAYAKEEFLRFGV